MKNIVIFKKDDKTNQFSLFEEFNNEDELSLWLKTFQGKEENLFIMKQLKVKSLKRYRCKACDNIIISPNNIIRATKNYLDLMPQYNIDYNIRVCPICGTIMNIKDFELIK